MERHLAARLTEKHWAMPTEKQTEHHWAMPMENHWAHRTEMRWAHRTELRWAHRTERRWAMPTEMRSGSQTESRWAMPTERTTAEKMVTQILMVRQTEQEKRMERSDSTRAMQTEWSLARRSVRKTVCLSGSR